MHEEFITRDNYSKLISHLAEECGEVICAIGKTWRFGPDSTNPLIDNPETNDEWIQREVQDLKSAIQRYEDFVKAI